MDPPMTRENKKNKRLVGLFLLGFLFFNYPLLSLFNLRSYVVGIPLLYLYIFSAWTVLIVMMIITTTRGTPKADRTSGL